MDRLAISILLYVIDLDVVEAVVEVTDIKSQTILIDLLINFHLILNILNPSRRHLSCRNLT